MIEEVKLKREKESAKLPTPATAGSVAYDVYAPTDFIVEEGRSVLKLGFSMQMPKAAEGLVNEAKIEARSGFSAKGMEGYRLFKLISDENPNDVIETVALKAERFDADVITGKIDEDFRGEVGVIIKNNDEPFLIKAGTRIAQMTFYTAKKQNLKWADELDNTDRGDGGFGGSGTTENNYGSQKDKSLVMEEYLLSRFITDPKAVEYLNTFNFKHLFTHENTLEVYIVIDTLHSLGEPVDVLTINDYITEYNKPISCEYVAWLSTLVDEDNLLEKAVTALQENTQCDKKGQ